jgi:hypothetical protein
MYWLYQNGYYDFSAPKTPRAGTVATAPPLQPGPRPGGGLNPFISDDDGEAAPQRPSVPSIPGSR